MTWGEIQIESLKKMFLNKENLEISDLDIYKENKKYRTYLFAMKQACNEALTQIYTICEPKIKVYQLSLEKGKNVYDLKEIIEDYENIYDIETPTNVIWKSITKNLLKVENWTDGKITIYYETKKEFVDDTTANDYKLNLDEEYARLIPLYIAGELYKDDDLSVSTIYMNEFNTMLSIIAGQNSSVTSTQVYRMDI